MNKTLLKRIFTKSAAGMSVLLCSILLLSAPTAAQTKVVVIPLGETAVIPEPAVIPYFSQSFVIRGSLSGGVTRYAGPGVQEQNDEDTNFMIVTTPGVVKKLFVYKQRAFETLTVTVRKNGVDTALAATLVTSNSGSNTADSFSVDTGDRISLSFFSTPNAVGNISATVEIQGNSNGP